MSLEITIWTFDELLNPAKYEAPDQVNVVWHACPECAHTDWDIDADEQCWSAECAHCGYVTLDQDTVLTVF